MQEALTLTLSILGILITGYISIAHLLKKKVICLVSSRSCNIVLNSKYSRTLGIKNENIGFLYYLFIIISIIFVQSSNIIIVMKIFSVIASMYSILLFIIQVKIIRDYCSWCIITAIINISLTISLFI